MSVVLYRVDERLIHGQVVIGWGNELRPDRYLVVDDALAESGWEQELYLLALPQGTGADFLDVETARERLPGLEAGDARVVVLVRNVETMVRIARGGLLDGKVVNLGGIHHAEGRDAVRPYLHLNEADRARIRELTEGGVRVTARDLPGSARVGLEALLDGE